MITDWFVPFFAILLAEFGDKTMLAVLTLSARMKNHVFLLAGAMCGFLLVDGFAVLFGSALVKWIPRLFITWTAGILFLIFGIASLRPDAEDSVLDQSASRNPFFISFSTIALSEWGDKTQIGTALFAAQFNPWVVLLGALSALFLVTFCGIFLGQLISKRIENHLISKISGIVFILIGISYMVTSLMSRG